MAGVRILLSCIFLIALVTSCNRQERKPVDPEEVLIRYTRFLSNEAIARHDTTALSAFWSPDYHVVTSRNFEVSGKKANLERLQNEFNAKEDVVYVPETYIKETNKVTILGAVKSPGAFLILVAS